MWTKVFYSLKRHRNVCIKNRRRKKERIDKLIKGKLKNSRLRNVTSYIQQQQKSYLVPERTSANSVTFLKKKKISTSNFSECSYETPTYRKRCVVIIRSDVLTSQFGQLC